MASGDFVLVRSFPDVPLARRVYQEKEEFTLICLEEEYTLWRAHGIQPFVAPCPRERIYEYNETLFLKMRRLVDNVGGDGIELKNFWELAEPYYSDSDKSVN